MKTRVLIIAVAAALLSSATFADDHLVQATRSGGLIFDQPNDAIFNKAGHRIPDTAPGQGSPFIGEHQCTPATATGAAQDHANVKPRGPDAGDCVEE
jgi:hypothetical protein